MDCPVCNKVDIGDHPLFCPQCEADLSVLYNIAKLKGSISSTDAFVIKKRIILIISILFISLLSFSVIYTLAVYNTQDKYISQLKSTVKSYEKMMAKNLESRSLPAKQLSFFSYTAKRGDSLWKLSRTFYGVGAKYVKIKEANSLASDNLVIGQILLIPNNQ